MSIYLKAALCAAAFIAAGQANAATFVISANYPAVFAANSSAFLYTYSAVSSAPSTFTATLSGYDTSTCTAPRPEQCVQNYNPYRSETITLASDPAGTTRTGGISFSSGPGTVRDILLTFTTLSMLPISVNFTPQSAMISAVPEPTTWALMLAGFGMVGYAMRRRRPQVVYA